MIDESETKFGGLGECALSSGDGGDFGRRFASGAGGTFCGRQCFPIYVNVFDGAFEIKATGEADAERDFLGIDFEGFIVLIEEDFGLLWDGINVEMGAAGFAFAVVSGGDVMPFIERDGVDGFEAEGKVGPTEDDVEAEFAVD